MSTPVSPTQPDTSTEPKLKIYFLPNLLTAGNLFCGFVALTKIVEANLEPTPDGVIDWLPIKLAMGFILLACVFDLFDGRVARMGGIESPFGREFDSLADLVSFGAAPAFLVHRVVLRDTFVLHPEVGWFIASIYLLCGAFRLARFNCLATQPGNGASKDFLGFPIPSAAGLVASLTFLVIHLNEGERSLGRWQFVPAIVLMLVSAMMVSRVRYPSFKSLGLRSTITFPKIIVTALVFGFIFVLWKTSVVYVPPIFFTLYLAYGFIRPRISRRLRHEIEEDEEDGGEPGAAH